MRVTLAQLNLTVGDVTGNVEKFTQAAVQAMAEESKLVVFPELALTGYYPGDLLDSPAFMARVDAAHADLVESTKRFPGLTFVVGMPLATSKPGKALSNGLAVIRDGAVVDIYAKQLLPTYNIFDERRHFEPGPEKACIILVDGVRIGLMICEDAWNDDNSSYAVNPFNALAAAAPSFIVSINASPANIGKREQRHHVIGQASARIALPILYVNHVGGHDQLVYDGASFTSVPSAGGKYSITFEAKRFEEDVRTLDFSEGAFQRIDGSVLEPVSPTGLGTMEFYYRQTVLGLQDYARRCGFTKVVVGCSGGIDSALTLALAVKALGPDNVVGITMPSNFSSEGSVSDSEILCQNLGIKLFHHSIKPIVSAFGAQFESSFATPLQGLPLENLQARARGTILMEFSNSFGHLLLTTGNKSEISVGYCTLYGDTNGGLGLIGDLYKTEVFELCRHINKVEGREVIPVAIIDKPPSAELAPGQLDTDSLPPYEVLDDLLRMQIEGGSLAVDERNKAANRVAALTATEEGAAMYLRIQKMIARNEYKRRQAPPIIRVRARAFGMGRQMPLAAKVL